MTTIPSRNEWVFGDCYKFDKKRQIKFVISQMLNRTINMFEYEGLPDTILPKDLELLLQVGGFAIFKEVEGNLYAFRGGLGGEPNPYYLPTIATIANPALKYSATLKIDDECVVVLNDFLYQGLMPLLTKYANLLVEAEISLKYALYNARIPAFIQADNDNTQKSAEEFIKKIVDGDDYGVIGTREFFKGLTGFDFTNKSTNIIDIIEAIQYVKASMLNDTGINSPFNMKREALNESETTMNNDILFPTVDGLLKCRQEGLEKVNKMFGTNITVKLGSVWAVNKKEQELSLENQEMNDEQPIEDEQPEEKEGDENVDN